MVMVLEIKPVVDKEVKIGFPYLDGSYCLRANINSAFSLGLCGEDGETLLRFSRGDEDYRLTWRSSVYLPRWYDAVIPFLGLVDNNLPSALRRRCTLAVLTDDRGEVSLFTYREFLQRDPSFTEAIFAGAISREMPRALFVQGPYCSVLYAHFPNSGVSNQVSLIAQEDLSSFIPFLVQRTLALPKHEIIDGPVMEGIETLLQSDIWYQYNQ